MNFTDFAELNPVVQVFIVICITVIIYKIISSISNM